MSTASYVLNKMDAASQQQIAVVANSLHFKLFLQSVITDCKNRLAELDCSDEKKLIADYKRLVTTREVYEELLATLSKTGTGEQ